jgi:hypothetical protein
MQGDDRARFCDQCRKNVYNLSEMTAAEAVETLNQQEGHPCVRFYMRRDGTAITSDCQVGLRWLLWRQLRKRIGWVAVFFAWLFLPACGGGNMIRSKYPTSTKVDQKKTEESRPATAETDSTSSSPQQSPGQR